MRSAPTSAKLTHQRRAGYNRRVPATIAAFCAAAYVIVLLALPMLDSGMNVLTAHPEDYARGPFGIAVNLSYLALAMALACLVLSLLPLRRWAIAVPVLLVAAAVLCGALAVDPVGVAGGNPLLLIPVFGLGLGPLVGSLSLRERFHPWGAAVTGIALAAAIAFAGVLFAPDSVGGAVNRVFDVLAGSWVAVAALAVSHSAPRLHSRI